MFTKLIRATAFLGIALRGVSGIASFDSFLRRAFPPIQDVSLVNATDAQVFQSLHNDSVVDLRYVGNDLNLLIELESIYLSRIDLDMQVIHEIDGIVVGNYSLFQEPLVFPTEEGQSTSGNAASTFGRVSDLSTTGHHRITVATFVAGDDSFVPTVVDWLVFDSRASDMLDSFPIMLTLIDADANIPIVELGDYQTVFLDELPSDQLSLRANIRHPSDETVESVSFFYADNQSRTEFLNPYALGGDINGDYAAVDWLSEEGQKAITVRADFSSGRFETKQFYFWVVYQSRPFAASGAAFSPDSSIQKLPITQSNSPTPLPSRSPVSPPPISSPVGNPPTPNPISILTTPTPTVAPVDRVPPTPAPVTKISGQNWANTSDQPLSAATEGVKISGEMRVWHKLTLAFLYGPMTSETASPNPFTDYRLDVTFTNGDTEIVVPGYYAADGDAANSGASSGSVWHCHFSPPGEGQWDWSARFVAGPGVAMSDTEEGQFTHFHGSSGSFVVRATNKTGRDLRGKGLLKYVGEHHLQFAETGEWFLKAGSDSPENFFAYEDFDNTGVRSWSMKTWEPHVMDYRDGDPTWNNGKGKGIIGAVNYLANQGMNAFSFLTFSLGGDDKNVFPHISESDMLRIDVSKTAQWEVVLEHGDKMGMFLHFKTQETENDHILDGGELGPERKLYYRELIARFGHHLAMNWNIGEENTNSESQRKAFADFFSANDPYDHPVVIHTYIGDQRKVYGQLYGYPSYDGASIQANWENVFSDTLSRVQDSRAAGRPWVVANDEQGDAQDGVVPDSVDAEHNGIRAQVLWGNIMAGGAGVEYYFGYGHDNSDLTCQDFRSRANMWRQSRYALEFFRKFQVPFQAMSNANDRISGSNWCLAEPDNGSTLVLYLPSGGTADIDLRGFSFATYEVNWYDPRNGGDLQRGSVMSVKGGSAESVGTAPNKVNSDWVVLLRCTDC